MIWPISFICEGCGVQVVGLTPAPTDKTCMCQLCLWLCECLPTEEIMEARRRIEPGGWIKEPSHKKD